MLSTTLRIIGSLGIFFFFLFSTGTALAATTVQNSAVVCQQLEYYCQQQRNENAQIKALLDANGFTDEAPDAAPACELASDICDRGGASTVYNYSYPYGGYGGYPNITTASYPSYNYNYGYTYPTYYPYTTASYYPYSYGNYYYPYGYYYSNNAYDWEDYCPTTYDPVCGTTGRTYTNSCAAYLLGGQIAYRGACR